MMDNKYLKNNLTVGHWNCNSINTKKLLFTKFIRDNEFDVFCLNETKLDYRNKNTFEIYNYNSIFKHRNRNGGGVGILVKNGIKYEEILALKVLEYEIIGVKLYLKNLTINIISFYLPPDNKRNKKRNQLTEVLFDKLDQMKPFILVGDLNCHSKYWFCSKTTLKGETLNNLLVEHDLTVLNTNVPTYSHYTLDTTNVIDLMIISNDIAHLFERFKVFKNEMTSDHFPISGSFNIKTENIRNPYTLVKKKIDWEKYESNLDRQLMEPNHTELNLMDMEDDYKLLINSMKIAENNVTTTTTRKLNCKTVPPYLLELIKTRKVIVKELKRDKFNLTLKSKYNQFTKLIKCEFKAIRVNMWTKFCRSIENSKINSSDYWRKIKQIGHLETKSDKRSKTKIPVLKDNGFVANTDLDKAKLFGSTLKKIFSNETVVSFDEENKLRVENFLKNKAGNLFNTRHEDRELDTEFTYEELENAIKTLKLKSAPGSDGIKNIAISKLSFLGKTHLLRVLNKSWNSGKLIQDWKTAEVTMHKKKNSDESNPNNYRPISLTKCLGKLTEKMIKIRLVYFLEKYNLISDFQSGFREKRQTTDNLFYLSQKIMESFDEKKSTLGVVFDIMKAFDKIWQDGLIFKLSKLNLPKKLGAWIISFIKNRKFYVKVEDSTSEHHEIEAGLGQGTVLSPILFSIYINDITELTNNPTNKISNLLFADDLFGAVSDKNIRGLFILM